MQSISLSTNTSGIHFQTQKILQNTSWVQGHWLPQLQELWTYQGLFLASGSWPSNSLFGWSVSVVLPIHALRGPSWLESYSVFQCIRSLKVQALYCSPASAGVWAREATVMAPSPTHDSAVLPCLQAWFSSSLFPPGPPPSCPLGSVSPQSIADLTMGLLYNLYAPILSFCAF